MKTYSNEIKKDKSGYIIKNYENDKLFFAYFSLIFSIFLLVILIRSIYFFITEKNLINVLIFFVIWSSMFFTHFLQTIDIKMIKINKQQIIFKYRLFPFFKKIKLKRETVKEISINYSIEYSKFFNSEINNKYYNIDLIDNELRSYRLYQLTEYNEDIILFAENISNIINVSINNQHDIENKFIYKKILYNFQR